MKHTDKKDGGMRGKINSNDLDIRWKQIGADDALKKLLEQGKCVSRWE